MGMQKGKIGSDPASKRSREERREEQAKINGVGVEQGTSERLMALNRQLNAWLASCIRFLCYPRRYWRGFRIGGRGTLLSQQYSITDHLGRGRVFLEVCVGGQSLCVYLRGINAESGLMRLHKSPPLSETITSKNFFKSQNSTFLQDTGQCFSLNS